MSMLRVCVRIPPTTVDGQVAGNGYAALTYVDYPASVGARMQPRRCLLERRVPSAWQHSTRPLQHIQYRKVVEVTTDEDL